MQGFGMLRLYIRNVGRLHLWDDRLRYPGVSMIHNHAWHLRSTVVSGELINQRYVHNDWQFLSWAKPYDHMRLQTGFDTRVLSPVDHVWMVPQKPERFIPGDVYLQAAHEIHETIAANGTITLMERHDTPTGEADVYWPSGTNWGTATPRAATPEEVERTVLTAIEELTKPMHGLSDVPD